MFQTSACRGSLNPEWNADFKIELLDDIQLQDNPLEFRVYDLDVVSSNDIIGIVYINIFEFVNSVKKVDGWFPLYDTIRGIRGEIHISLMVSEKIKEKGKSSIAQRINTFACDRIPKGGIPVDLVDDIQAVHDPESYFIDAFRASRTSNEARQLLLLKEASIVRRHVYNQALELNCTDVYGYRYHIELERDEQIVVRGLGTAVTFSEKVDARKKLQKGYVEPSDDIKLFTITSHPSLQIVHLGGVVSVTLVTIASKDPSRTRGKRRKRWLEMRDEIKKQARNLGCTHVLGYNEKVTLQDDDGLVIMQSSGTAVSLGAPVKPCCSPVHCLEAGVKKKKHAKCLICGEERVPNIVLSTIDVPDGLGIVNSRFIQCSVARQKKSLSGEANASEASGHLQFLEYELHKQIEHKLRLHGMNGVFNMSTVLTVGDELMSLSMTGTAVCVASMPIRLLSKTGDPALERFADEQYVCQQALQAEQLKKYRGEVGVAHSLRLTDALQDGADGSQVSVSDSTDVPPASSQLSVASFGLSASDGTKAPPKQPVAQSTSDAEECSSASSSRSHAHRKSKSKRKKNFVIKTEGVGSDGGTEMKSVDAEKAANTQESAVHQQVQSASAKVGKKGLSHKAQSFNSNEVDGDLVCALKAEMDFPHFPVVTKNFVTNGKFVNFHRLIKWKSDADPTEKLQQTMGSFFKSFRQKLALYGEGTLSDINMAIDYPQRSCVRMAFSASLVMLSQEKPGAGVIISSADHFAFAKKAKHIGYLSVQRIKESFEISDENGIGGFVQSLMFEVLICLSYRLSAVL